MTDREMLLFAYGALKALEIGGLSNTRGIQSVVETIEAYLYPAPPEVEDGK
jgi:hypothetical protein